MASLRQSAPLLVLVLAAGCMREGSPATEQRSPALAAGRPAPEIEGVDAQGRPFRLSDYRGKVVMLHFWRES
jgi:hypothetical protein